MEASHRHLQVYSDEDILLRSFSRQNRSAVSGGRIPTYDSGIEKA